jgi:muramoyltetrapeptide carboxypeptidase LdcA involved in peptidoglycan recycling
VKPASLREGDTVGIISPSWGGRAAYTHRVERGVEYLESLGFRVRIAPHAMNSAGAILFLETSAEKPSPETVDGILMDYENMGAFARIAGLLFGLPYGYTSEERERLHEIILDHTRGYGFPVVADMDFGHTSSMLTLPVGCRAVIDAGREQFEIVEVTVV